MLLLTAVTFGGNESVEAFDHLPDEESEILKHRARGLLEIPREQRIPLLVQEIKRLITARRRQLGSGEPPRLAKVLENERSALVEVILKALPVTLAVAVRKEMPQRAPVKLKREVRQDILSIVRWKLEDALKEASPKVGVFKFSDLLTLQQRDLLTICDRMGARALATAFAGLNDEEQAKVFNALPPDQKSLAQRASEAGKTRKLTEGDSRTVLEMYGAVENPSAGMRSAGAQRLARACLAQGQDFAVKLIDRHTGELGKLLSKWVKEERHRPIRGDGGRGDIVEQMERLAQRGVLDRPVRLPPPPNAPPPAPAVAKAISNPGQVLAPVPQRKSVLLPLGGTSVQRGLDRGGGPVPQAQKGAPRGSGMRKTGSRPRRDFMAERNARMAGAASSRLSKAHDPSGVRAVDPRVRSVTDPKAAGNRPPQSKVLRDGKPMERVESEVRVAPGVSRKAVTSPALVPIPRRKEKPQGAQRGSGFYRSPVVKGSKRGSDE
ncbi:MAG: hypothetical protein JNK82_01350 [Myxococcaceae bacterium]|nr:hypothetical protein [Myxococcaceae bacterium]